MSDGITRRRLGLLIAASPALAAAQSGGPTAEDVNAYDEMAGLGEVRRQATEKLAAVTVPLTTDPAFVFRP